ncbi:multiple sugar transport system ATP-binding protein [Pseudochrobactrum saccharolyticum]|uniref:Multiple sugar transport system ATP-binding protein n=1 Tax=Pseudochrobactrum saccharolyticum TaxID=354352 RepID=A0A7W8AKK0_9HYPH|nr:ABC transporter ATP-binding protein [Pseudochrobactrum saccharolyticum]KAB0538313.1 ABC transporter ATP-binding protein [Pseudochrobactrum saccharolyticum]MBB5091569.1 multiple sugar transport system ATP-binding protein [Pseudochrobactrum saccharolyticum]
MTHIQLDNLHKSYGALQVIKGVDLEIASGEFMVFVGPSGSGKSTLLRMISGLEDITDGTLLFDGNVVNQLAPSQRGIAMVFQSYALYPHMTTYRNMAFGLKLAKHSRKEIDWRVREAAEMLQITPYLESLPRQLSGGQRQRVAIGRAIVRNPRVFLFDEPLSNLDAALRVATRIEITRLKQKMPQTTMIYVTHDQVEAMTLADRICILREGRVEQVGTPSELYEAPCSLFVAGFVGSPKMNILNGRFAAAFGAHTVGIRPEHLILSPTPANWSGKVILRENLGAEAYLYIDIGAGEPLIVRDNATVTPVMQQAEKPTHIAVKHSEYLYKFDASGHFLGRGAT